MIKQVIAVRTDLNMGSGKIAAQVAHASMKVFFDRMYECTDKDSTLYNAYVCKMTDAMKAWKGGLFTKIVVKVKNFNGIKKIVTKCEELNVPYATIHDSKLDCITCVAVGPEDSSIIDQITGKLRLLD